MELWAPVSYNVRLDVVYGAGVVAVVVAAVVAVVAVGVVPVPGPDLGLALVDAVAAVLTMFVVVFAVAHVAVRGRAGAAKLVVAWCDSRTEGGRTRSDDENGQHQTAGLWGSRRAGEVALSSSSDSRLICADPGIDDGDATGGLLWIVGRAGGCGWEHSLQLELRELGQTRTRSRQMKQEADMKMDQTESMATWRFSSKGADAVVAACP